jgi:acyl dehydratase
MENAFLMKKKLTINTLQQWRGREIGLSDWILIDQKQIHAFADCTRDHQWIHVNEKRARKSPLKGTVAHGFLLLSLFPHFLSGSELYDYDLKMIINYGLNRVRFISPVKSGARIRNRAVLTGIEQRKRRKVLLTVECTIEIEGGSKPAVAAELLVLLCL